MIAEQIQIGIIACLFEQEPGLPIYVEQIKQGFQEPAFFVLRVDGSQQKELNRRYRRSILFNVHYFPEPDSLEKKTQCHRMAERLYEVLETIEVDGGLMRGKDLHHQVIDEMLHFFITFDVHLIKTKDPTPKMQHLEQEVHLNG